MNDTLLPCTILVLRIRCYNKWLTNERWIIILWYHGLFHLRVSTCCTTANFFSAGGFVGSVTSVVLAELSFSQLSHTAGSFDPGAPPLHSRLCRVSIQEAPGVQMLSGTRVLGLTPTQPQPHPGPQLSELQREQAAQCRFTPFRIVF